MPFKARQPTLAFIDKAEEIREEFSAWTESRYPCPYLNKRNTFKRQSYALIRSKLSDAGGHNVITAAARYLGCAPTNLYFSGNEFHYGLAVIDQEKEILKAQRLSLLARQMTYAHLHDVPPRYLIGFLYQSGSSVSISKKLKEGYEQPGFGRTIEIE